jgi:hypothetical protein
MASFIYPDSLKFVFQSCIHLSEDEFNTQEIAENAGVILGWSRF